MVRISAKEFPEKGDLVIGNVTRIAKHGVYVNLKEYEDVDGYCHISEIAGTFIRNIRNFVKIGEMVVARVLRVNEDTKQIDISLKRVSDQLKRDKMQEYKRQNAALAICNLIAERTDKNSEEIRDIIEDKLTNTYGSMYNGFEEMAAIGEDALEPLNDIPDDLKEVMLEVASISIQITTVSITSILGIRSFASDGVDHVKKLLNRAEKTAKKYDDLVESEITSIGAPQYRIFLEGRTYKEVLEVLDAIEKDLEKASKKLDVEYVLERKKN